MVAHQQDNGIVPQFMPIHDLEDFADLCIGKGDTGMIRALELFLILLREA